MAKYFDCEQNTPEWHALRIGIPTSSNFHRLITPKKMEPSESRFKYLYELLAEWVTKEPLENATTTWMDRGHELEDSAISAYELLTEQTTVRGGFVSSDNGLCGCSPDRLVGAVGGVEIKCRLLHVQIEHALRGAVVDEAACQIKGTLMISERDWWDVFSFHPGLIIPPVRVHRDEKFELAFRPVLDKFIEEMLQKREELEARFGPFVLQESEPPERPQDFITDEDIEAIMADVESRHSSCEAGRTADPSSAF